MRLRTGGVEAVALFVFLNIGARGHFAIDFSGMLSAIDARPARSDFIGAAQSNPGFEHFVDEVFVPGLAVLGDDFSGHDLVVCGWRAQLSRPTCTSAS